MKPILISTFILAYVYVGLYTIYPCVCELCLYVQQMALLNVKADICQLLLDSREYLEVVNLIQDFKYSDYIISYIYHYRSNVLW
jgi:hypothetical protein